MPSLIWYPHKFPVFHRPFLNLECLERKWPRVDTLDGHGTWRSILRLSLLVYRPSQNRAVSVGVNMLLLVITCLSSARVFPDLDE